MNRPKRGPGAWTSAVGRAAFAEWLRRKCEQDGRPTYLIARDAGVAREGLRRILREPGAGMFETSVRKLAVFFGADPDEIAAIAGHANVQAVAPEPRQYSALPELLQAARRPALESTVPGRRW